MTETQTPTTEGKLPFVLTFSYTERMMGQMLVYATSEDTIETEVVPEYRAIVPDFTVVETQPISEEEANKIKASFAEADAQKLN